MPFIRSEPGQDSRRVDPRCSFCGKDREHVVRLIHGPGVSICNECVDLCNRILGAETASTTT